MQMRCRAAHLCISHVCRCVYVCMHVCKWASVHVISPTHFKLHWVLQQPEMGGSRVCMRMVLCVCVCVCVHILEGVDSGIKGLWFETKLSHIKQAGSKSTEPLLSVPVWHHNRMLHPTHFAIHTHFRLNFFPHVCLSYWWISPYPYVPLRLLGE